MNKILVVFALLFLINVGFSSLSVCSGDSGISACCAVSDSAYSDYYLTSNIAGGNGNNTCILINLENSTLDLRGYSLSNINSSTGTAIHANATNVTIYNGTIRNSTYGVVVEYSNNTEVYDVYFETLLGPSSTSSRYGIYVNYSTNASLYNNTFHNVSGSGYNSYGVYLVSASHVDINDSSFNSTYIAILSDSGSSNITINNNSILDNDYGIYLSSLNDMYVYNNTIMRNYYGFYSDREDVQFFDNNLTLNYFSLAGNGVLNSAFTHNGTTVDSRNISSHSNSQGLTIDSTNSSSQIIFNNVSNSVIQNLDLSFSYYLIYLSNSTNITLDNVTLNYSYAGVYVLNSNVTIINNSYIGKPALLTSYGVLAVSSESTSVLNNNLTGSIAVYQMTSTNGTIVSGNYIKINNFAAGSDNTHDNLTISSNTITYNASSSPSEVEGRPSATRFYYSASVVSIVCERDTDLYGYQRSTPVQRSTDNYNFASNTVFNISVGMYLAGVQNATISNNYFYNYTDGLYSNASDNVTLSGNTFQSLSTASQSAYCSAYFLYKDYRTVNSNITFTSNTLSEKTYSIEYTLGDIIVNNSALPAASPYQTSLGQLINVSNLSSSASANLTFHYTDTAELLEDTLRMYRHNGSWGYVNDLSGVSCAINTSANTVKCTNITTFSVFGLFGQYYYPSDDEQPPDPGSMSISTKTLCENGNTLLEVTVKDGSGNLLDGVEVKVISSGLDPQDTEDGVALFTITEEQEGTYNIKAEKSGYSNAYKNGVEVELCDDQSLVEETFTVTPVIDCEEQTITFYLYDQSGEQYCDLVLNDALNQGLNYYTPEDSFEGYSITICSGPYTLSFDEYKEYSVTFESYDGEYSYQATADTSECSDNQLFIDYEVYCENSELSLTITDQNGECVVPDEIDFDGLNLYQSPVSEGPSYALVNADVCSGYHLTFDESSGTYPVTASKEGYASASEDVIVECGDVELNEFVVHDLEPDCDEGYISFTLTDKYGDPVPFPTIDVGDLGYYEGESLYDIVSPNDPCYGSLILKESRPKTALFTAQYGYNVDVYDEAYAELCYPTMFQIPFNDDGTYTLEFSKYGFKDHEEIVNIQCGFFGILVYPNITENDTIDVPENNIIIIIDEEGNEQTYEGGEVITLSSGNYTVILADEDGQVLATKDLEVLEKPESELEEDFLAELFSKNILPILLILLILVGTYMYIRRTRSKGKKKGYKGYKS